MLALVALLVATLVGVALGRLTLPRQTAFRIVIALVLSFNVLWWLAADRRLAEGIGRRHQRAAARILCGAWVILVCWPVVGVLLAAKASPLFDLPVPSGMAVQLWHMGIAVYVVVGGAVKLPLRAGRWLARTTWRGEPIATSPTRRALLRQAAVYAPIVATGGGVLLGLKQQNGFEVNRRTLRLPRLPDRLAGLTVTHLSDIHVGRLVRPDHLPKVVDAVNRLASDLVFMTGDLVDLSNDLLPAGVEALAQIEAPLGLYMIVGNHDLIDDGEAFVRYCRQRGLRLLVNEHRDLSIGGERITLAGLGWSRTEHGTALRPGHVQLAERTLAGAPADRFTLVLAHHPHAFDALAARGVDLTLSGHTHGGQLMLVPPGFGDAGIGRLLFRYVRGLYRQGDSQLVVSSGVGNWFPVRLNAPAEITQLRLT